MINKPTCYKNPDRPSCIDLILTNCPRSFQNSCVIETGQSDFHKMAVTVIKTTYRKLEPRIVHYRDFRYFCNNSFKESLQKAISQNLGVGCDEIYESFAASCNKILDNHAPLKEVCERQSFAFKAIMVRRRLRNILSIIINKGTCVLHFYKKVKENIIKI